MAVTNWTEAIDVIVKTIETGRGKNEINGFEALDAKLSILRKELREVIQHLTEKDIVPIIQKLKKNKKLDARELQMVRLWMIGDAEYYVTHENNFESWLQEMRRLQIKISALRDKTPTAENIAHLQALLLDLDRTTSDVVFYMRHKKRVDKFIEATAEIDDDEAEVLVHMLETKRLSPDQ